MCIRVSLEKAFAFQGNADLPVWYLSFLHRAVCQDGGVSALKEVQDAIIASLPTDTQFVDPVSQQIGFRPPQFVTKLSQPLDLDYAFVLDFGRKRFQPFQYGDISFRIFIENYSGSLATLWPRDVLIFANVVQLLGIAVLSQEIKRRGCEMLVLMRCLVDREKRRAYECRIFFASEETA